MDLPIAGHASSLETTPEMGGAEPDLLVWEQLRMSDVNPGHTVCKGSGKVHLHYHAELLVCAVL